MLRRKSFFLAILLFVILSLQNLSALTVANIARVGSNDIHVGEFRAVLYFEVRGTVPFRNIRFYNTSTSVPYGSTGITEVSLYRDRNGNKTFDAGADAPAIATKTFTGGSYTDPQTFDSNFGETITATTNYFITYTVYDNAAYNNKTYINLQSLYDDSGWTTSPANNYDFNVIPSGLTYVSANFTSLLPSGANVGQGLTYLPVMQFVLRAYDYDITVKTIKLKNKNRTYGTDTLNNSYRINKITLLCDNGNHEYNGRANETLVLEATMPHNSNDVQYITLYIPTANRITVPQNDYNTPDQAKDRYFYVLYDVGSGFTPDTSASCALNGADAYQSGIPANSLPLRGAVPAGDVQFTVKNANLILKNSQISPSANNGSALCGQKNLKMATFYLDVKSDVTNATWVVRNGAGTFSINDDGVSRVSLYKDITPPLLIAATTTYTNSSLCSLSGINMTTGQNQGYYIAYDIGLNARPVGTPLTDPARKAYCQLDTIKDGNVVFAGVVPAPEIPASVVVSSSRLWVQFVSVNTTSVRPGESFQVDIGVMNISLVVDGPAQAKNITLAPHLCKPRFYANAISGNDISSEYTATEKPGNPPYLINSATYGTTITYSYTVVANNLKTNGPVILDAQMGYYNVDLSEVIYTRHYRDGILHPAAEDYDTRVDKTRLLNISSAQSYKGNFPSYIDKVETRKDQYSSLARFVNNDIIDSGSQMYIYFANDGAGLDLSSIIVKLNGNVLHPDPLTFTVTSHNIWIKDIGDSSGVVTVEGYAGTVPLTSTVVNFTIESGFVARDLLGNPNPYNPDAGNCRIGFYMSEAGKYDIYIYDASGAELVKEKDNTAKMGYNIFDWDGNRKNGKKVGRGVYLVKVVAKGSKDKIITTKIGVR